MALECYADGSCPKPHLPGGWAYVILVDNVREETVYGSGREPVATNNTMEMMAVHECMKRILKDRIPHRPVYIYSDSQYVVNGCNTWMHTWADIDFMGVKNADMWKDMLVTWRKFNNIRLRWIKGHSGIYWNEYVDKMASHARKGRERARLSDEETATLKGMNNGT